MDDVDIEEDEDCVPHGNTNLGGWKISEDDIQALDIQALKDTGHSVVLDDDPLEGEGGVNSGGLLSVQKRDFNGLDTRKIMVGQRHSPQLLQVSSKIYLSMMDLFLLFFPMDFMVDTIMVQTNDNLPDGFDKVTVNEFVRYLGLWMLMGSFIGEHDRRDWWYSSDPHWKGGYPFRSNEFMSRRRFDMITIYLKLHDKTTTPDYPDKFHSIRPLVSAWNDNMTKQFSSSWMICLDESMMVWTNKLGPGWLVVPRKPHPVGNECNSI